IRRNDQGEARRSQVRRLVSNGYVVFQLLPRPDNDLGEVSSALWRATAGTGESAHRARDGYRGIDPTGYGRDHGANGAASMRDHGRAKSVSGGRRGTELREQ